MRPRLAVSLLCLLSCLPAASAQDSSGQQPAATGIITAVSPGGLDLDGIHLHFTPDSLSSTGVRVAGGEVLTHGLPTAFLGQRARVFGAFDHRANAITVERLSLTAPASLQVAGFGIVDLLPPNPSLSTHGLLRADGYLLAIGPKSTLTFLPPLTTASDLRTNLWVRYRGTLALDGTVLIDSAEFSQNEINDSEDRLRKNHDYDPAAVDPNAHQGAGSKFIQGIRPEKIPPWPDAAMQARVDRIGQSLVPAYQRALPEDDPTKLHFRFQVIDYKGLRDALNLPSGVIVIPHQVIDRLENDSQLATILADNIAEAVAKQAFRAIPAQSRLAVAEIAGAVGGLFVPGLGIALPIATGSTAEHLLHEAQRQSGRISLCYLHDAGFDLKEAPRAWWLLASRNPKSVQKIQLPFRAEALFLDLGTTWRSTVSPSFHGPSAPPPGN